MEKMEKAMEKTFRHINSRESDIKILSEEDFLK